MIIAFHTPDLNIRGTCRALYDYAHYNEVLLHNKSVIITKYVENNCYNPVLNWFSRRFRIIFYTQINELITISKKVDLLYFIKYGKRDETSQLLDENNINYVIHSVFDLSEPHGKVFAAVSQSLAKKFGHSLFVPHMIDMQIGHPKLNLRKELNIPESAVVFGRYGGKDTFNLEFAKNIISKIVRENANIYFLFMNCPIWDNHSQIINLEPSIEIKVKQQFINTCDAMIVPETMGHTGFLAGAEFSIHNKPIIIYNGADVWNTAHIDQIGEKGIYFATEKELENVLINFDSMRKKYSDWNCYREFTPKKVMKQFEKVFL